MNQFKIWQIGLIYSVLIVGIIFAMPNFYPTKPALQIAFGASSSVLNTNIVQSVTSELEEKNIEFEKIELNDNSLKIIFDDVELAKKHLLNIWDNPLEWWNTKKILSIRSEFQRVCSLKTKNDFLEWYNRI